MPVRVASYGEPFGLLPIFEMNLPEGALRERLRLAFAKAAGTFDDLDLLAVVGRSLLGRLRFTAPEAGLDDEVPFQSVDEILQRRRSGDLFRHLLDRFARFSGLSGVQPKVLIRDENDAAALAAAEGRRSQSVRAATHIVKLWDAGEFPELAANEYFCLCLARECGLAVPRFRLAEDGIALVVDRFDLRSDGTYRGVEDFCVLNARATAEKYRGGYENSLFRRLREFMAGDHTAWRQDARALFTLFAVNCAIRNGDAHLKNFAVAYDHVDEVPRLAPVYDLVTTTAYLPHDRMALTLDGTTRWPSAPALERLATTRCGLAPKDVAGIFERIADAMADLRPEMRRYAADHPGFAAVHQRMAAAWEDGVRDSLGFG
jgi:serine/threonine-protein kinase HipA